MRPVVGWASDRFGRRPLLWAGRCSRWSRCSLHLAATTLPAFIAVRGAFGVAEAFFFVRCWRPPATSRRRTAAARRSTSRRSRCTSGSRSGRRWARSRWAPAGYAAVWIAAAALAGVAAVPRDPAARDLAGGHLRDRRARPDAPVPPRGGVPGRARRLRGVRDGRVPGVRAAVRAPGRPRRGGAAAGGLRPDRRRAPVRVRQAARPGGRGEAVGRRARRCGGRAR